MLKKIILNVAKLVLAIGLILWLVNSGKVDMQLVKQSFTSPLFVGLICFFLFINHGFVAYRWRIILETKSDNSLKFLKIFNANWIGLFFNSVLPGAVTGDLIKIFYVEKEDPKLTKKFLLASVFLDRLIGLFGLIILGGVSSLISYDFLSEQSVEMKLLVHANFFLSLIVIASLILLFFFKDIPETIANKFTQIKIVDKINQKLLSIWNNLVMIRDHILKVFALSILIQAMAIIIFWYVVVQLTGDEFSLLYAFSILPMGFIAIALPIAPAGLGVGHLVFLKLFSYIGIPNGANLFNVYFIYIMLINLSGVIPYIFHREKKTNFEN